jgi:acyl-CoA thioester hydrolase
LTAPIIEIPIEPRFYETDALGHINNVSIAGWMEMGRTQLIRHLATTGAQVPPESWVVVSLSIEFVAETFYGEDVLLSVTDLQLGNTSMTIHCELRQSGRVTVRCKSVLVYRDPSTGDKKPLPQEIRARFPQ